MSNKSDIIELSEKTSKKIAILQDMIGNSSDNSGIFRLFADYRKSLREAEEISEIERLLRLLGFELTQFITPIIFTTLTDTEKYLLNYSKIYTNPDIRQIPFSTQELINQILAIYNSQAIQIRTLKQANRANEAIFGTGSIVAYFGAGFLARAIASIIQNVFVESLVKTPSLQKDEYVKQAIAAIDRRTTETCRNVNGQIQPVNKPFKLEGIPKYASSMQYPGFHDYCRTVVAIFLKDDV